MTIMHIITCLNDGGAEGVLARLCLQCKGVRHVVVSLMDDGKYGLILQEVGIPVYCLGMNSGELSFVCFYHLIKLLRNEQPDVVQTWMYHADLLGGLAARLAGIKHVFWGVRHSTLEKGKSKTSTMVVARLCALLSNWVPEKIICCAQKALVAHAEIGYNISKLCVVHNGYDLKSFTPNEKLRSKVRLELGIGHTEFVIGTVGRFDPLKDHRNLLEALMIVAKQNLSFKCVLVGRMMTCDNVDLMSWIRSLGLQERVLLVGQRTDIPAVMNALDLHVLSSCSEGFPNVVAEAMACGTPCVSTDAGDASEIIGDTGVCCPICNAEALADAIITMHNEWKNEPKAWLSRKAASAQRIADRFSVESMSEAYEKCWTISE